MCGMKSSPARLQGKALQLNTTTYIMCRAHQLNVHHISYSEFSRPLVVARVRRTSANRVGGCGQENEVLGKVNCEPNLCFVQYLVSSSTQDEALFPRCCTSLSSLSVWPKHVLSRFVERAAPPRLQLCVCVRARSRCMRVVAAVA